MGSINHKGVPTVVVDGITLQWARRSPPESLSHEARPISLKHPPRFGHGTRSSTKKPLAWSSSSLHDDVATENKASTSRNQFAALTNAEIMPPITPPTSDDGDDFPTERNNSVASTCITTPGTSSAQKTGPLMLGSNLESLMSHGRATSSSIRLATLDAAIHSTPTPKSKLTSQLSPSSENGQRLFELAAKLASSEKRGPGQKVPEPFQPRIDEKFRQYDEILERKFSLQLQNGVYVYIDWSNFLIGCRETVRQLRGMGPLEKLGFWVNFDRVKYLIERRRPIRVRDLAGSRGDSQAANDQLDYIKTTGYHVMDPQRRRTAASSDSEDTVGRKAEQCVDELLQLQILHALYDTEEEDRGVLVLASGDGQDAEFSAGGFLKMVQRALKAGWCVELYAFSCSISSAYLELEEQWPGRLTVHLLDDIAEALVEQE